MILLQPKLCEFFRFPRIIFMQWCNYSQSYFRDSKCWFKAVDLRHGQLK